MLRARVIVGLILAPIVLAAVWIGSWPCFALVIVITVLAMSELFSLAGIRSQENMVIAYVGLLALLAGVLMSGSAALGPAVTWFTIAIIAQQIVRRSVADFSQITWPLFIWTYIGILGSHIWLLRDLVDGRFYLMFALLTTWAFDTVAFFVGRRWGHTYFCPEISPHKSVQGFAAGLVAAAGIAAVLAVVPGSDMIPGGLAISRAILLGCCCAFAAQAGDLAASLIKRATGAKDSGRLLPGHGGVLDRIDSLLFAIPVLYYLVA